MSSQSETSKRRYDAAGAGAGVARTRPTPDTKWKRIGGDRQVEEGLYSEAGTFANL